LTPWKRGYVIDERLDEVNDRGPDTMVLHVKTALMFDPKKPSALSL
jgi:hypothetical protein